jgi:hypothetical protein
MYERFKLCERLTAKEICFVVERYQQAKFVPEHNEHILRGKVAEEAKFGVLRCFVSHFGDLRPDTIVRCHLTRRGKEKTGFHAFSIRSAYSELGVQRFYCGSDTVA